MREGLLRRKPGEALSHLQNKCVNIFDKDRKMIEFFHEPCYTGTTFRPNHRIGEEGFMNKQHSKRCLPIRKHREAREKRYSFGYAVFLILALMK